MSREDLDQFLTDEGRRKVDDFIARCDDDDFDINETLRRNLEDHARAYGHDKPEPASRPYVDQINEPLTYATVAALRAELKSGDYARFRKTTP